MAIRPYYVVQRLTFNILHGYEELVFMLSDLVNDGNVLMGEGGSGAGFMVEAFFFVWITGEGRGQKLQGHRAVKCRIMGLVHHTHPALTELFQNPVMGNSFTDHFL
jgi:hypothetical protein